MQTDQERSTLPALLLAQGQWARRLARRLIEGDQAEDLVQEAYLAGLRRPPRTGESPRGWLATVMRHLAQNQRSSTGRRRKREVAAMSSGGEAPSAEEALGQVQLHRRLAALVERLPETDRRIVVLRFFEEQTSEQIAAAVGVPAGTVRWRLTRILAQLRAWLDEEEGGRGRWVAALAPLAGASVVVPGRLLPVAAGVGALAAAAILVAVLFGLDGRRGGGAGRVTPAAVERVAALTPTSAVQGGGRPIDGRGGGPALAVAVNDCPAQRRAALGVRAAIDQDLRRYEEPGKFYDGAAAAEPAREQTVRVQLAGLLEADAGDVLECRAGICRVTVIRHPDADARADRAALLDRPWAERLQGALERLDHQPLGGITRDPLSGGLQQRYALYLYLSAAPTGAVAAGDCPRALQAIRQENEALALRQDRAVPPPERFARGRESNPVAAREVEAHLARALGAQDAQLLQVACRRDVCRLRMTEGEADPDQRLSLSRRLNEDREWTRQMRGGFRGPEGALYYRVAEPRPIVPEDETNAATWKRLIGNVVAACQRCNGGYPRSDQAEAIVLLPGPGELNADGEFDAPSVRLSGPSAQRSYGRCLRREIVAVLARGPLPPGDRQRELKLSFRGARPDSGGQTNR